MILAPIRPNRAADGVEVGEGEGEEEEEVAADGALPVRENFPARAVEVLDEEDGGANGELHPAEEARAARPARDPGAPTAAMVAAHAATHVVVRGLRLGAP